MNSKNTKECDYKDAKNYFHNNLPQNLDELSILTLAISLTNQKDSEEIATNLLNEFGNIPNILVANHDQLAQTKGVNNNLSYFFKLLYKVKKRINHHKIGLDICNTKLDYAQLFSPLLCGLLEEGIAIATFDVNNTLIRRQVLSYGSGMQVTINLRTILKFAIQDNARKIAIAHNHPMEGSCEPSNDDIYSTAILYDVLDNLGIELVEHLIFCKNEYTSIIDCVKELVKATENNPDFNFKTII